MRGKNRRWILAWATAASLLQIYQCENADGEDSTQPTNSANDGTRKETRGLFSPRMDYDQWTPLGRGDPLKNDPTYDYVPPVLERVHYWIDPALRKPDPPLPGDNQKTEILVLGVSSKKPSTGTSTADNRRDTYDPFVKYVDGPTYPHQNNYQRIARPTFSYFSGGYFPSKNKIPSGFQKGDQRVPYTMLVPPPPHSQQAIPLSQHFSTSGPPSHHFSTSGPPSLHFSTSGPSALGVGSLGSSSIGSASASKGPSPQGPPAIGPSQALPSPKQPEPFAPTSPPRTKQTTQATTTVSIEQANLIYQSSSISDGTEWQDDHLVTIGEPSSQVTWRTPLPNSLEEGNSTEDGGKMLKGKEEGKKVKPAESYVHFQQTFSGVQNVTVPKEALEKMNFKPLIVMQNDGPLNNVMIKGQVSDGNLDEESTYVNIGKPEAQMDSSVGFGVSGVAIPAPNMGMQPLVINPSPHIGSDSGDHLPDAESHYLGDPSKMKSPETAALSSSPDLSGVSIQTLQTMQTMQPPPISLAMEIKSTSSPLLSVLQSEVTEPILKDTGHFKVSTTNPSKLSTTKEPLTTFGGMFEESMPFRDSSFFGESTMFKHSPSPFRTTPLYKDFSAPHGGPDYTRSPNGGNPTRAPNGGNPDLTRPPKGGNSENTRPNSDYMMNYVTPTPPPMMRTSTTTALTTDPLFKHYKQPSEPLRGPMYLIIQGHSKVKTYGPSKQIHGISIQETNEIPNFDEKEEFPVKHLHGFKKSEAPIFERSLRSGRSNDLQSLTQVIQSGLGSLELKDFDGVNRRNDNVQETEVVARFDVSNVEGTSEKYYKGIVETARRLKDAGEKNDGGQK